MDKALRTVAFLFIIFFTNQSQSEQLSEEYWDKAEEFDQFYISVPFLNTKDSRSAVKITSSASGIHVLFEVEDYIKTRKAHISPRDGQLLEDYVEFIIDLTGDGNTAYGFRVSVNGSVNDFILDNEKQESRDWDGDWIHYISIDEENSWEVELMIPWSTTIFDVDKEKEINTKFYAAIWSQEKRTKISTPNISTSQSKFMSNFRPVKLEYSPSTQFKITPFITYDKEENSNNSDQRSGATLLWKRENQGISYAYQPDFGQVESNDLVLNLSGIETFFSEKREFFLEQSELYSVKGPESLRIFHSPRIGSFSGPNEETLNIEHALKYNLFSNGFEFGVIYSNEENVAHQSGREFQVLRGRYSSQQYNLGILTTHTESPSENKKSAVKSIDYEVDIGESSRLNGFFARSEVDIIGQSKVTGNAHYLSYDWDWNDQWSNHIGLFDYDSNFDVGDAGFVARVNRKQLEIETEFGITDYDTDSWVESSDHTFKYQLIKNQNSLKLGETFASANEWILLTKQVLTVEVEYYSEFIDDYVTRGNNPVNLPAAYTIELDLESSPFSGWTHSLDAKSGQEGISGDFIGFGANITYSLNQYMTLGLGIDRVAYDSYLIWDEENVIEEFDATESEFELFINARFDDSHFLDIKFESVALKARALTIYEAASDGALAIIDDDLENQSIGEVALQIRYHYQPSQKFDLYVVYSRGGEIEQENTFISSSRLIRNAYNSPEVSRFFVKAQYSF
ncbi:MAG: DUF5916 domain-containing protein [Kangiellaceae bacterium]|nr:DUF5916 domain-containing protein [Kangiellaceae bacterium]